MRHTLTLTDADMERLERITQTPVEALRMALDTWEVANMVPWASLRCLAGEHERCRVQTFCDCPCHIEREEAAVV